jgi:phosphoglycolate phosphatase
MTTHNANIEALLFDLDGTLVDTAEDFVNVLNKQRRRYKLTPLPATSIRNTVSDGARALTKLAFGGGEGEADFESKKQELLDLYLQDVGIHSKMFEGMESVLALCESLSIPWGIITNKPRIYTDKLLVQLDLFNRSSVTLCPDDVVNAKPDPESILLAAERLNVDPTKAVYVGDHERDILAGRAANMKTVAVSYGYIKDPLSIQSWRADHKIDHPSELISLFLSQT